MLIDDAGRCIGRSPGAMDRRGLPHLDEFRERLGEEETARRTGQPVHPTYTAMKLAHWRTRRVDEFRRTRSVLDWQAFLNRWLCGEPVTDPSLAIRLLLYDPFEGAWWNAVLDALEPSAGQLPEVREAGAVARHLRRDRAEELGLRPGLPVRVGAWDQACAALAGGVHPGVLMDSVGTTQAVIASAPATPSIEATLRYGYQRTPAATPGGWLLEGGSLSGALVLRWLLERVAGAGAPPLADLLQSAGADPASVLVLPHLTGAGTPHPDPAARAVILGADFDTSLADLVVGALDGVHDEARANIDAMRSVGVRIDRVHVTGGLSRHPPALPAPHNGLR